MVVTLLELLLVGEKKNLSFFLSFFFFTNLYMKQGGAERNKYKNNT